MIDVIKIISFSILIIEHFYIPIVLRSFTNIKKKINTRKIERKNRERERKEENSFPMWRIKSVLRRVTSTETNSEMTRNSAPVSRFEFYSSFLLHLFLFPPFVSQVNRETSHVQTYTHRHYTLCFHISIVKKNSSESSPMALPSNNK